MNMGGMNTTGGGTMPRHRHMMMHMTFFWGRNTEVLFHGFPGFDHLGTYVAALVMVFLLAVFFEWLSHSKLIKESSNNVAAGLLQTAMYSIRVGLAYLVMLAVMSFNGGIFLVAVAGHALGFLIFGSRVFNKPSGRKSDLPPMTC